MTRADSDARELITATFDGDGLLASLTLTSEDQRREQQRAASARYRWSSGDAVPQILTQRADPALDDAERDRPDRLSADFAYGYGRTFASWAHGSATFHRDAFGSQLRTEDTEAWAQAGDYGIFGAPEQPRHDHQAREQAPPKHREDGGGIPGRGQDERQQAGQNRPPQPPELPRFGYRGELALGQLLNLRARIYDTGIGQFTTPDPLLSGPPRPRAAANPYAYASNDPVNHVDPLGLLAIAPPGAAQVRAMAPVGALQTAASAVLAGAVSNLAAGTGGDLTTLHNAARIVAAVELVGQEAIKHGYPPR